MKVLALKWRRLGDTALWTAALEALRSMPNIQLDLAYPEPYQDIFSEDPRFPVQHLLKPTVMASRDIIGKIREASYDWILVFHASNRGLVTALLSGARKRALHHHDRSRRKFFSQLEVPQLGKALPATERDLNLVRALGWQGPSPTPKLIPNLSHVEKARMLLSSLGIHFKKPLVVMGPFASRPAKQWPLTRYSELGTSLKESCDVVFIYESESQFSSKSEKELLNRTGTLLHTAKLKDALGVLALSQLFVGPDSGLKHIACAYGVRTVTFFGPESVGEWHPYSRETQRVLQNPVVCRDENLEDPEFAWCGRPVCPLASHACLLQTSTASALAEIHSVLKLPT